LEVIVDFNHRLLSIIGRRFPAIFDVIPRGPEGGLLGSRASWAALNPQPLPPLPPPELGAAIAAEFIQVSWLAQRLGVDWRSAAADLDDWCPTAPKKPKLPLGWPPHLGDLASVPPGWPNPEPHPHPPWFVDFHVGFAARLAVALPSVAGTPLESALSQAIDRSIKAIEAHPEA
jgi:hypothetical protein